MTPESFKANPAQWHQTTDLTQMLSLLQHLANDVNVTVALLAADFAERTVPYAGDNKALVESCIAAVRAWARDPTKEVLQECIEVSQAAADAHYATTSHYSACAAASAASAAYAATSHYAADAVACAASAAYNVTASAASRILEKQWQLAHVRAKHPLTEL